MTSFRWVETPLRALPVHTRAHANKTLVTTAAMTLLAVGALVIVGALASTSPSSTALQAPPFQAVPVGTGGNEFATIVPLNIRPSLVDARKDLPLAYSDGCNITFRVGDTLPTTCIYGNSGPLIALFGDSHALHWLGALLPGAEAGDYRVAIFTANACPPYDATAVNHGPGCPTWQAAALSRIDALNPSLVLISASAWRNDLLTSDQIASVSTALADLATDLEGTSVAWVADNPSLTLPADACALEHVQDLSPCTTERARALDAPLNTVFRTAADANHWAWIDMNDYLCDERDCGIIREDVLMYRDASHLTDTFSTELAPRFKPKILALLGQ